MDAPLPSTLAADWAVLLQVDPMRAGKSNDVIVDEVFDHGVVFPLQRRAEMRAMLEMACDTYGQAHSTKAVCVIGSDKGADFYHFLRTLPGMRRDKAIAIEIRGCPYADTFKAAFPHADQLCIGASSYDLKTVAKVREFLAGDTLDVLFIDGDKSRFDVDFYLYAPMVKPGGVIFLHDIVDDIAPRRFFYSLRDSHRLSVIIDGKEGAAAGMRKDMGEKPRTAHEGWLMEWRENSCGVGVVHT